MAIQTTQGSRYRGFTITCKDKVTGTAVNLTGATLTGRLLNIATGTSRAIDGALAGADLPNGVIQWSPGANDVGTAGAHELQITATVGGLDLRTFRTRFDVEEAIPAP